MVEVLCNVFDEKKARTVLIMSTLTFVVSYMVWMMLSVIGVPIKKSLNLSATQFSLLTFMPLLIGSIMRAPLGILSDRFGGRITILVTLILAIVPVWLVSQASLYWEFLLLGLFIGLGGATYGAGIPYIAHWFPRNRQGFAMGVYGAGSVGGTLGNLVAPALIAIADWTMVPKVYACLLVVTAFLFWLFGYSNPLHFVAKKIPFMQQLKVLTNFKVLQLCLYYAISFGAFGALSFWMVLYYVDEFNLTLKNAALLTACFTFPASIFGILGGWLADKYGGRATTLWVLLISGVCLLFLSCPNTHITIGANTFSIGLNVYIFTMIMFIEGVAWSIGKASIYKWISEDHADQIGAVSGVVGAMGGIGGAVWLILFGILLDLTGIRSTAFMLLFMVVCSALTLMRLVNNK